MKQEDFDRLKAVCEKEGFEISNEIDTGKEKYLVLIGVKEKDIWEGVEFFQFDNKKHYKVKEFYAELIRGVDGLNYEKIYCIPSTESAYIEQLKSEAFKRFGEIKEGDRFDFTTIDSTWSNNSSLIGNIFNYDKSNDRFTVGLQLESHAIYQKGKWATRVKERVKVEPNIRSINDFANKLPENQKQELKEIIASKLEEYLNKD